MGYDRKYFITADGKGVIFYDEITGYPMYYNSENKETYVITYDTSNVQPLYKPQSTIYMTNPFPPEEIQNYALYDAFAKAASDYLGKDMSDENIYEFLEVVPKTSLAFFISEALTELGYSIVSNKEQKVQASVASKDDSSRTDDYQINQIP